MNNDSHESPETSETEATSTTTCFTRPPYTLSGVLLLIGICNLLLLNGQFFTNTVVFLAFVTLSAITWLPVLLRSKVEDHRRIALYVLFAHAVVVLFFATGLPDDYRRQHEFNKRRDGLRQGDVSLIVDR